MKETQTLLILKGLPASGKTTYARGWVAQDPDRRIRVNKDDIRKMLGYTRSKEGLVVKVLMEAVYTALTQGFNVVVDDTNFNPIHKETFTEIVSFLNGGDYTIKLEEKLFSTSVDTCIARDAKRTGDQLVGPRAIREMADKYKDQLNTKT